MYGNIGSMEAPLPDYPMMYPVRVHEKNIVANFSSIVNDTASDVGVHIYSVESEVVVFKLSPRQVVTIDEIIRELQ